MPWPVSQDYIEAIQTPSASFADAELKAGEVLTNGPILPVFRTGDSSEVFAVMSGGRRWAVKCFTQQVPGLDERYAHVSRYVQHVPSPFLIDCAFQAQGIRVRGDWYPVVKMPWVEDVPLNTFVRDNLDRPPVLHALAQDWGRLAARLHETGVAHGDLQHANILVVPGNGAEAPSIVLVDYDGMCVPGLEHLQAIGAGHVNYQHPQRLREGTWGAHTDRFSLLVIYTALRALGIGGRGLWQRFDTGDNLLFTQADFAAPAEAEVFQALLQLNDSAVTQLTQMLARAAQLPISSVPVLDSSVMASKPPSRGAVLPVAAAPSAPADPPPRQLEQRRRSRPWLALTLGGGIAAAVLLAAILFLANLTTRRATQDSQAVAAVNSSTGARATRPERPPPETRRESTIRTQTTPREAPPPPVEPKKEPEVKKEPEPKKDPEPRKEPAPKPKDDPLALVITSCPDRVTILAGGETTVEVTYQNPANLRGGPSISWNLPVGLLIMSLNGSAPEKKLTFTISADPHTPAGEGTARISVNLPGQQRPTPPREFTVVVNRPEGRPAPPAARERRRFDGAAPGLWALAVTADGRHVYAGGSDRRVRQWEVESGRHVRSLEKPVTFLQGLELSADDGRLLTQDINQPLRVWDTKTGAEVARLDRRPIRKAILDGTGRKVVFQEGTTSGSVLHSWNLETNEVQRIDVPGGAVYGILMFPNNRQFLTVSADGTPRVLDLERRAVLRSYNIPTIARAALSADGRLALFAGNDKSLQLWDLVEGRKLKSLDGLICPQHHVVLSRDGSRALSFGPERLLHIWDVANGRVAAVIADYTGPIPTAATFTPTADQLLVAAADGTLRLWDIGLPPIPVIKSVPVTIEGTPLDRPPAAEPVAQKRPAPTADKQAEALKAIRERYRAEYAKTEADDRIALASRLIAAATETKNDPVARFALLHEAGSVAAGAGDMEQALAALDQLEQEYAVDGAALKTAALATAAGQRLSPAAIRSLIDAALRLVDDLAAQDRFDAAVKLLSLAEGVAQRASLPAPLKQVQARSQDIQETAKEAEAARAAEMVLKERPGDPEASLTLGKYHCFRKRDWDRGLLLLAAGKDEDLKALARKDLAQPGALAAQVEVGDGWWDLAVAARGAAKARLQQRAAHWYQQALPGAMGLTKLKLEARLKEAVEDGTDHRPVLVTKELRQLVGHTARVNSVAFSADGKQALTGSEDRSARLWDVPTGQELVSFPGLTAPVRAVALSGDGRLAVAACNNLACGWEIDSRKRVVSRGFGSTPIESVAFLPDHQQLLVGQAAGALWVVPTKPGVPALAVPRGDATAIHAVAVSGDGRLGIVGGGNGLVQLYLLDSRREQGRLVGHKEDVLGVALTRDARLAVTAGADRTVRVWDTQAARQLRTLTGHQGRVTGVALSADGRRAVTGSEDRTVRIWDIQTGRELWRLAGHTDAVTGVALSPDGRQVLSAGADRTVRVWELSP